MIAQVYCSRCNHLVQRETNKDLRKEYKYYCPHCDENMYSIETYKKGVDKKCLKK
jgi:Zn finger protein HypA/HybF involved in hydrogenase expression